MHISDGLHGSTSGKVTHNYHVPFVLAQCLTGELSLDGIKECNGVSFTGAWGCHGVRVSSDLILRGKLGEMAVWMVTSRIYMTFMLTLCHLSAGVFCLKSATYLQYAEIYFGYNSAFHIERKFDWKHSSQEVDGIRGDIVRTKHFADFNSRHSRARTRTSGHSHSFCDCFRHKSILRV